MKVGKVPEAVLKRSIIKTVNTVQSEKNVTKAGVGKDAGLFDVPGFSNQLATACTVITGNTIGLAELAILRACNSLAAACATPVAVTVQLVFPEAAEEEELKQCMSELSAACKTANVALVQGHTQIEAIAERVVSVTAIGAVAGGPAQEKTESDRGELLMTKYAGVAGTALLAGQYREELHTKYTYPLIDKAAGFKEELSVLPEAKLLTALGVTELHDVAEGGVLGAVWELCERNHVGVELDLKKIPIHQETVEISEYFDLNPYQLRGDGSLLFITNKSADMITALAKQGIVATVIGRITKGNDRILKNEDEIRFLEPNRVDEYYKACSIALQKRG